MADGRTSEPALQWPSTALTSPLQHLRRPAGLDHGAALPQDVIDEEQPFGWGATQPPIMRATVVYRAVVGAHDPERKAYLGDLLEQAREVALDIGAVAEAERHGFHKNYKFIEGRGYEYINFDNFTPEVDLQKPGILLFPDDAPDARVISMSYNITGSMEAGPPDIFPLRCPGTITPTSAVLGIRSSGSVEIDAEGKPYADDAARASRSVPPTSRGAEPLDGRPVGDPE